MPATFVIVGASLAGGTAAATLRQDGFDGDVILIGEEPHPPYERPPLSKQYLRGEVPFEKALVRPSGFYQEHGIDTRFGVAARRIANVQGIYAAGDVANHYHPVFQKRMRVEHWQNAMQQSAAAARSMLDRGRPYDAVHWFWSDQYDVNLQYAGFHQAWDQVVVRGHPDTRTFIAFYLSQGRIDAVAALNRGNDVRRVMPLIKARTAVDPRRLADDDVDLRSLVDGRFSGARA